jgi:NitT/TauT family transport system substrate-binding protein
MMYRRVTLERALFAASLAAALMVSGCTAPTTQPAAETPTATAKPPAVKPAAVKIGTLPTEDSLPLWVAEQMGYFNTNGLDSVEIISFQSAQERDAAFAAGAIDAFMGDIIASANLEAGGSPNTIETVMLGADQSQGRFAVVVPPKSKVATLSELDGVAVGTSSATIQEYVLDGLMSEAGVAPEGVKVEEVKKVPVRFELLMANKLKAAALPEPFVTLAENGGAKIVGDDTKAKANLSQTVLVFSDKYLAKPGGAEAAAAVLDAWNISVDTINVEPEQYRKILVEKARLPKPLAATYKVNTYPKAAPPTQEQVDAVLTWMRAKGYLKADVGYADLVNSK